MNEKYVVGSVVQLSNNPTIPSSLGDLIKASSHGSSNQEDNDVKNQALADFIRLKFKSGNSVPIDRVIIKLEEVEKWL